MGKLYVGVSRKRKLTRKLSNVKSRGVVTQRTRSPNSQKEHLTFAEKGVLIFPGVWQPRFQTGMGEASVGHHQLASSSQMISGISEIPPVCPGHHSGIWFHWSNYSSVGFYALSLYWKCVGIFPTTTLTLLNVFLHFYFTEVSEKRQKTWLYILYLVPDCNTVQLCYKETFQTTKKNSKWKGKSIKSCDMEITTVNILRRVPPGSSSFSGSVWSFQRQPFISESSLLSLSQR